MELLRKRRGGGAERRGTGPSGPPCRALGLRARAWGALPPPPHPRWETQSRRLRRLWTGGRGALPSASRRVLGDRRPPRRTGPPYGRRPHARSEGWLRNTTTCSGTGTRHATSRAEPVGWGARPLPGRRNRRAGRPSSRAAPGPALRPPPAAPGLPVDPPGVPASLLPHPLKGTQPDAALCRAGLGSGQILRLVCSSCPSCWQVEAPVASTGCGLVAPRLPRA